MNGLCSKLVNEVLSLLSEADIRWVRRRYSEPAGDESSEKSVLLEHSAIDEGF
jgi:hypothetical protein